jgi:hypothetical protein
MTAKIGQIFKPGDVCQASGIYQVIHDPRHSVEHEVTCVYGKKFPPCRSCPHPRFKLLRAAHHLDTHEMFKRSTGSMLDVLRGA